jgi:hypothetical protein
LACAWIELMPGKTAGTTMAGCRRSRRSARDDPGEGRSVHSRPLSPRPAALAHGAVSVAAAAVIAAALNVGGMRSRYFGSQRESAIRLAVLPFENLTGDPNQEYFSDGLTEEMITQLGRLHPDRLKASSLARHHLGHTRNGRHRSIRLAASWAWTTSWKGAPARKGIAFGSARR